MRKLRILTYGISTNLSTGYSKIMKYLVNGIKDMPEFEVWCLGMQSLGWQSDPHQLSAGQEANSSDVIKSYIEALNIDILITICDNWIPEYHFLPELVKETNVIWINHTTVNLTPVPFILYEQIKEADYFVAPSDFVKTELEKVRLKNVYRIYHGVNNDIFHPQEIQKLDKFTYVALGTNKFFQKGWLELLKAMKYLVFDLGERETHLVMVTESSMKGGYNLPLAIEQAGLNEYVTILPVIRNAGLRENQIAGIYNQADCYVTATLGESFGFSHIESMACGVPNVGTNFSATKELIEKSGAGYTAEVVCMLPSPHISEFAIVDYKDLALKMQKVKNLSPEERKVLSENGIKFAQELDWKNILPQWRELLLMTGKPKLDYLKHKLGV